MNKMSKMVISLDGKTTGERIKLARQLAGLTRAELAAELCVSDVMVYNYETGRAKVHPRKLRKIAEVCGVSFDDLEEDNVIFATAK